MRPTAADRKTRQVRVEVREMPLGCAVPGAADSVLASGMAGCAMPPMATGPRITTVGAGWRGQGGSRWPGTSSRTS